MAVAVDVLVSVGSAVGDGVRLGDAVALGLGVADGMVVAVDVEVADGSIFGVSVGNSTVTTTTVTGAAGRATVGKVKGDSVVVTVSGDASMFGDAPGVASGVAAIGEPGAGDDAGLSAYGEAAPGVDFELTAIGDGCAVPGEAIGVPEKEGVAGVPVVSDATNGDATAVPAAGEPAFGDDSALGAWSSGDATTDACAGDGVAGIAVDVSVLVGLAAGEPGISVGDAGEASFGLACNAGDATGEVDAFSIMAGVPAISVRIASGEGVPIVVGLATDGGSTVADVAGVWLAGGATIRGVSVARGDAFGLEDGPSRSPRGDPVASGDACRVAARSAETWVRTLGGIVMTSSFGWELERVSRTASRRLASKVPAAINALVRFNDASRSRRSQTPALGLGTATARLPARVDSFASADFTLDGGKSTASTQVRA